MAYQFKKYNLSTKQLQHIAGMCQQEQGSSVDAVKFEASLAANLYESHRGKGYATINDYIRHGRWFADSSKDKTTTNPKLVAAVKDVLCNGNRVLPPQIDEHDWVGDIKSLSSGGNKNKRSSYKQFETVVHAIGTWTFYCWPSFTDDPFGTTKPAALKKWLKKYAIKGQYFWGDANASEIKDATIKVDAKIAPYGPTYTETKEVTVMKTYEQVYKKNSSNPNSNSNIITPETKNKKIAVKEKKAVTVKRKYAWTGHGTPESDLKAGNLVCAAPPDIPFGTKIKISDTGNKKWDGKTATVKDRLDETKVKNNKYYFAILTSGYGKEKPGAWLNGKVVYELPTKSGGNFSGEDTPVEGTLVVNPDKLYSSDNYAYIQSLATATETASTKLKKSLTSSLLETVKKENETRQSGVETALNIVTSLLNDTILDIKAKVLQYIPQKVVSKTMVSGSIRSTNLPVLSVAVEAPYFELDIGGVKFGGYHNNKIPNYVKSMTIKKVNGSINEYSISLIHQVRPGDNPNYIDNILSATGYNYITVKYGDASTGQIFNDYKALITNVAQTFDFTNCNIIYNISATSIAAESAATRYNFSEFTGKVSDRIRWLLYESATNLLDVFPGMSNRYEVEKQGLIPVNDAVVTIGSQIGVTAVNYLLTLVERMENSSTSVDAEITKSIYRLTVQDSTRGSTFKINEITSNVSSIPFMYEVNVGYPDDNFVLNFNVNDNFAYAVTLEGAKKIVKYDYELNALGNLDRQRVPAYYQEEEDKLGFRNLWSSLTRFPVNATLTVRGLLQDSLLMQYIKVNCVMYGAKRISSGVYIVTEQTDNIGNGVYSTTLSLLRVAGDNEYITIDGRKRT